MTSWPWANMEVAANATAIQNWGIILLGMLVSGK
jgi:hypothetical protein